MDTEVCRFKVGDFECMAVSDGRLRTAPPMFPPPATILFSNAPTEVLARVLGEHDLQPEQWTEWISPYTCLLINAAGHLILVDTGAGGLAPSTGKLILNLKAAGIEPDDIDTVILTHAHPDHIGGNIDSEGKLTFPKARYVMWKREWDFWMSGEAALNSMNTAKCSWHLPREVSRQFKTGSTLLTMRRKSCRVYVPLPPLVIRQVTWRWRFRHDASNCCASLILFFTPCIWSSLNGMQWSILTPKQVVATRRRLLNKAAVEKALVLAFHFPFPGLGHVVRKGTGWQWRPIHREG